MARHVHKVMPYNNSNSIQMHRFTSADVLMSLMDMGKPIHHIMIVLSTRASYVGIVGKMGLGLLHTEWGIRISSIVARTRFFLIPGILGLFSSLQ